MSPRKVPVVDTPPAGSACPDMPTGVVLPVLVPLLRLDDARLPPRPWLLEPRCCCCCARFAFLDLTTSKASSSVSSLLSSDVSELESLVRASSPLLYASPSLLPSLLPALAPDESRCCCCG